MLLAAALARLLTQMKQQSRAQQALAISCTSPLSRKQSGQKGYSSQEKFPLEMNAQKSGETGKQSESLGIAWCL